MEVVPTCAPDRHICGRPQHARGKLGSGTPTWQPTPARHHGCSPFALAGELVAHNADVLDAAVPAPGHELGCTLMLRGWRVRLRLSTRQSTCVRRQRRAARHSTCWQLTAENGWEETTRHPGMPAQPGTWRPGRNTAPAHHKHRPNAPPKLVVNVPLIHHEGQAGHKQLAAARRRRRAVAPARQIARRAVSVMACAPPAVKVTALHDHAIRREREASPPPGFKHSWLHTCTRLRVAASGGRGRAAADGQVGRGSGQVDRRRCATMRCRCTERMRPAAGGPQMLVRMPHATCSTLT